MTGTTPVEIHDVEVALGGRAVLSGASLTVAQGQVTALVGPNGSGKTTLLRVVYRALRPVAGTVLVDGTDLLSLGRRAAARTVAAAVQEPVTTDGMTVSESIGLGRLPHLGDLGRRRPEDDEAVHGAAARVDVSGLLARDVATLSGGERQRVHLARALAQQTPVLLLDEPTNHLDIRHQYELLAVLRSLGCTVLLAVHDLAMAAERCDAVAVLSHGAVVASGSPAEVLTPALLADVFGVAGHWAAVTGRRRLLLGPLDPSPATT